MFYSNIFILIGNMIGQEAFLKWASDPQNKAWVRFLGDEGQRLNIINDLFLRDDLAAGLKVTEDKGVKEDKEAKENIKVRGAGEPVSLL